ncbi:MAG: ClcB-like voltage-gated chloride channel protein [Proteobacteria bacterium]|nr:ClcB-like voltage-gated chloride channel protein [Pseudomonadota bacterium]
MLLWAALAGVAGAFATVAFRETVHGVEWLLTRQTGGLVQAAMALPWWQRLLTPAVGGLLAGLALIVFDRLPKAKLAPDYMEAVAIGDGRISAVPTLVRSLSSGLSVGSGGALGREGSMVQLAAMVGSAIGRIASFNEARRRLLVACGAAAGIASAYNAPVAGALFVSEIVLGSIAMTGFGPLLVAAVMANLVIHHVLGYAPTYRMPQFAPIGGADVLPYIGLGVLAGVAGPQFLRLLDAARAGFRRLRLAAPWRLALGGLGVGLLSVAEPQVWGNGYSVVDSVLNSPWTWQALFLVLATKLLATSASVGSGAVGGVFTPTLFVGAVLGALFAHLLGAVLPGMAAPGAYAVVGMGAMLAATTHAPLMAIMMISEMTLSFEVVLPVVLASVAAYSVARIFRTESVYAASLRRDEAAHPGRPLADFRIADLMKPESRRIAPDTPLPAIAGAFSRERVQYLYVTDAGGRYLGAVSLHDVAQRHPAEHARMSIAADLLIERLPTLTPDMNVSEALMAFARHHGERLPVVEPAAAGGRLVGSVTKTDVLLLIQGAGKAPA